MIRSQAIEVRLRKGRRRRRALAWIAAVVLLGIAANAYIASRPEQVRARIEKVLRESLRGEVRFAGDIDVDWRRGITLYNLAIIPPGGEPSGAVLRARRLVFRPKLHRLLLGSFELEEVVLDAPELLLDRGPDGEWSWERVLPERDAGAAVDLEAALARLPRIRVLNGAAHYRDEFGRQSPARQDILDLEAVVEPGPSGAIAFHGAGRTQFIEDLHLRGAWKPGDGALELSFQVVRLDLSGRHEQLLPSESFKEFLRECDFRGFVDLEGTLRFDPREGMTPVEIGGRFLKCRLHPPGFPFPLERLEGAFTVSGSTLQIPSIRGGLGEGTLLGSGSLEWTPGWKEVLGVHLRAAADGVPLDARFRAWMQAFPGAGEAVAHYDRFRPRGSIGIELSVDARSLPRRLQDFLDCATLKLMPRGVEFTHQEFPYRFSGMTGEVTIAGRRIAITQPLTAHNGAVRLVVTGWADIDEEHPGLEVDVRVENLPLDDVLRSALPAPVLVHWDAFRPSGPIILSVSARREKGGEPEVIATATGLGVRILYEYFPYEIEDITGKFIIDFQRERITLVDLRGRHGAQEITAKGLVQIERPPDPGRTPPDEGAAGEFLIEIHCDRLEVDKEIKAALPAGGRALLEDLRFQGSVATDVKVYSVPKGDVAVEVEIQLHEARVAHVLFPYPLELTGGRLVAVGDHTLTFSGVQTTAASLPRVTFSGGIGTIGGERIFDFRFDIDNLKVDDRLRQALPADLRRFVDSVALEGIFAGTVEGTFSYDIDHPERNRVVYHARAVRGRDAAFNFGVALRGIEGEGEFVGGKDLDGKQYFTGVVKVHTAWFNRLRLEETDIIYTFGKEHPGILRARQGRKLEQSEYLPGPHLVARLAPGKIADVFQLQVRSSKLYGGKVQGFAYMDVGPRRDLGGEFTAEGIQVAQAAPDVFKVKGSDITGTARGSVSFSGKTGDALSITGSGTGIIEKARLIELPLFVGLVSLLFLNPSVEPHFNEVEIQFDIRNGRFWAPSSSSIAIRGDALNLLGHGSMTFDGGLDIALTPYFLEFTIPVVDWVLDLVKKTLVQVWVQGKIEDPKVRLVHGAGLIRIPVEAGSPKGDRIVPSELENPKPPPRE